ncbi:MAG TPA: penicillin-binding transpeptidase domain-containing protein [Actinocrinis sp.]|nr:penicillin-binding transpeptidase domain-containing protein [Actinocrinis sp.]
MTDETRRDREPVDPDRTQDALADWFRPRDDAAAQSTPDAKAPGAEAPKPNSDDKATAPPGVDAAAETQLVDRRSAAPKAEAADETQLVPKAPEAEATSEPESESESALKTEATPESETEPALKAEAASSAATASEDDAETEVNAAAQSPDESETEVTGDGPGEGLSDARGEGTAKGTDKGTDKSTDESTDKSTDKTAAKNAVEDLTQALPLVTNAADRTELIPQTPPTPASAPTQAIPRSDLPLDRDGMAVRPSAAAKHPSTRPLPQPPTQPLPQGSSMSQRPTAQGGGTWAPQAQQPQQPQQPQRNYARQGVYPNAPASYQSTQYQPPGAVRTRDGYRPPGSHYDEFDEYDYDDRPRGSRKRGALITAAVGVVVVAIAAALVLTKTVSIPGLSAKAVPTVGFSPSGSDAGSDATQTGSAFLTAWQNSSLQAAANITDNPSAALTALTAYKTNLKVSGLTLLPGSASSAGWMTFNVTAQVGAPASAWTYSSGLAAYQGSVDGVTRWFVKWQPAILFTSLASGQKLGLGLVPATANSVTDRNGTQLTSANAPSLGNIITALEKNAPAAGTPGQKVQIEKADGTVVSTIAKVSDPVSTSSVKTTLDATIQAAAQSAVNRAPNSSMVVIQPSTGNILAIANNPPNGLDTAMLGRYAPGSTFKTVTTTLLLNSGKVADLNQGVPCPATLSADGITLHNSEAESGAGFSFLDDFAQSCNNAFSSFFNKVTRDQLVSTAHDYFGFNQKWDVGLGSPTAYGNVPNTSSNSLAEELVGQDQITASPLTMAAVAAAIDNGSFKQPILVPGTTQISATPLSSSTQSSLKTLMHAVVTNGTLAGVITNVSGAYGKTGTAQVQGKQDNSWTIAFRGDYAIAALAVGGGFGASTAGPEVNQVLNGLS